MASRKKQRHAPTALSTTRSASRPLGWWVRAGLLVLITLAAWHFGRPASEQPADTRSTTSCSGTMSGQTKSSTHAVQEANGGAVTSCLPHNDDR